MADRLTREAEELKAQLEEARATAKAADAKTKAAEAAAARLENVAAAVANFTRGLADHENAEKQHEGPIELKQLAPRFDKEKAELEAVALEEMGGSTTAAELAELVAAMDETEHTEEARLATLSQLGRPTAHVLSCAQCKELLRAIKGDKASSERMIAVENVGPRVKDPENAIEVILPFFGPNVAEDVSHCAVSVLIVQCLNSSEPLFSPCAELTEREGERHFLREPRAPERGRGICC